MARILILRAAAAAAQTLAELDAAGHDALLLPVDEIVPLWPECPDPAGFGAAIATSVNAVPYAALHVARTMPMVAVGAATGAALRSAGFRSVAVGKGEADRDLLALCAPALPLLFLAGRVRTAGLERAANTSGRELTILEVYDTRPLAPTRSEIVAALDGRPAEAILVLSQGQAAGLARLHAQAPDLVGPAAHILCISERVRSALAEPFRAGAEVVPLRELKHRLARL